MTSMSANTGLLPRARGQRCAGTHWCWHTPQLSNSVSAVHPEAASGSVAVCRMVGFGARAVFGRERGLVHGSAVG